MFTRPLPWLRELKSSRTFVPEMIRPKTVKRSGLKAVELFVRLKNQKVVAEFGLGVPGLEGVSTRAIASVPKVLLYCGPTKYSLVMAGLAEMSIRKVKGVRLVGSWTVPKPPCRI